MKKTAFIALFLIGVVFVGSPALGAEDVLDGSSTDFMTYYYLNPEPDKIPSILQDFLSSEFFKSGQAAENNGDYIMAYSLGRIAQLEPSLVKKYEDIFEQAPHKERLFILKIFQVCGNEEVEEFLDTKMADRKFRKEKKKISKILADGIPIDLNVLEKEARDSKEFDFLWAEFMVTGDERAVRKLIDALEWPDRMRAKLNDYLKGPASIKKKQEIVDIFTKEYNIICDISTNEVETKDDLDTFIFGNAIMYKKLDSKVFKKIDKALKLTDKDVYYMATKGSASWSLTSNAQQHKKVFEICDNEISRQVGSTKIALLRISAYGHMVDNNIKEAIDRLKQLTFLNPKDAAAHFSLGLIYLENGDIENALEEMNILKNIDATLSNKLEKEAVYEKLVALDIETLIENEKITDRDKIIGDLIEAIDGVKNYQSRLTMRDYSNEKLEPKNYVFIEWRFGHEKPEKFSVEQYANEDENSLYDMWISVKGNHYDLLPVLGWIEEKTPELVEHKNSLNYNLSIDKYIKLIKENKPDSIMLCEGRQGKTGYFIIKYELPKWNFSRYYSEDIRYRVEVWAGKDSLLLTKALIKLTYRDEKLDKDTTYDFTQLVTNYNNVAIQPPAEVYVSEKSEFMSPEEFQEIIGRW
ncbi:MAG: hypothetical protein HQ593_00040 [Candidatus Omnitrophica bacterium]|nr:hypothetical protein [Candidatus Omnitrophota bacterium]